MVGGRETPSPTSSHSTQDTRNTSSFTTANEYQHTDSLSSSENRSAYESAAGSPTPTRETFQTSSHESASTPTKAQRSREKGHKKSTKLILPAIPLNFSPPKRLQTAAPPAPETQAEELQAPELQAPEEQAEQLTETLTSTSLEDTVSALESQEIQLEATPLDSLTPEYLATQAPAFLSQDSNILWPIMEIPAPELTSVNEALGLTGKEFEHYYICEDGLIPSRNVLGIPANYAHLAVEGRAVEIRGVPGIVNSSLLRPLFKKFSNNSFLYDICMYSRSLLTCITT